MIDGASLASLIVDTVRGAAASSGGLTHYRAPLVGFADAGDPRFAELRRLVDPSVLMPSDILPGAKSVVSFFLPFAEEVVAANRVGGGTVAREWAVAYIETNTLLAKIAERLIDRLSDLAVRAAADPPTGRFDRERLFAPFPHKSAAVIAGLGTLGVHSMLITESGCAGRLNTVVVDADLPTGAGSGSRGGTERCAYLRDGSCLECVNTCPAGAIRPDGAVDKRLCWIRCRAVAQSFSDIGLAEVCGKCATARCALKSG